MSASSSSINAKQVAAHLISPAMSRRVTVQQPPANVKVSRVGSGSTKTQQQPHPAGGRTSQDPSAPAHKGQRILQKSPSDPTHNMASVSNLDIGVEDRARDADGRRSVQCPFGTRFPSRKSNMRHSVDSTSVAPSPCFLDVTASTDEFFIRGCTPAKKLLNSGSTASNESAPRHVPLKAFVKETAKHMQHIADSTVAEHADVGGGKLNVLDLRRMGLVGRSTTQIIMSDAALFGHPHSHTFLPSTPISRGEPAISSRGLHHESEGRFTPNVDDKVEIVSGEKIPATTALSVGNNALFSIESTRVVRVSSDSGLPDEKGLDYDSAESTSSNMSSDSGMVEDLRKSVDKGKSNSSAAAASSDNKTTASTAAAAPVKNEKCIAEKCAVAGAKAESKSAAVTTTAIASPAAKQSVTVHSSTLSRQLSEDRASKAQPSNASDPIAARTQSTVVVTTSKELISATPAGFTNTAAASIATSAALKPVSNTSITTSNAHHSSATVDKAKPTPAVVLKPKSSTNTPAAAVTAASTATSAAVTGSVAQSALQPATAPSTKQLTVMTTAKPAVSTESNPLSQSTVSKPIASSTSSSANNVPKAASTKVVVSSSATATQVSSSVHALSSLVPHPPASSVQKASVKQHAGPTAAAVDVASTPDDNTERVNTPAKPVKAIPAKCVFVKPATVADQPPAAHADTSNYDGPVIIELYASLRRERDASKLLVDNNKEVQKVGRIGSAGMQQASVNAAAKAGNGKSDKTAAAAVATTAGKARPGTGSQGSRKGSAEVKSAAGQVSLNKSKTKKTTSGKRVQTGDSKPTQSKSNTRTAVRSDLQAHKYDSNVVAQIADGEEGRVSHAEAISEYESDFASGEDSESELMGNPLDTRLNLKSDEQSDCESDEDGQDLHSSAGVYKKYTEEEIRAAAGSPKHLRRISEGSDLPSPHQSNSGRRHCRVKSDVTADIVRGSATGQCESVTEKDDMLMSGSWRVIRKPYHKPAINVSQGMRARMKSPRFVYQRDSFKHSAATKDGNRNVEKAKDELPNINQGVHASDMVVSYLDSVASSTRRTDVGSACPSLDGERDVIQWRRGDLLGKGAYGKVWRGLTNSGIQIAVKQIEVNVDNMDRAQKDYEKIQEEVQFLKMLQHPHIVSYIGTSLEENVVSIFMEFVPGGSIAWMLSKFQSFDEEIISKFTRQILEAVDYLHNKDIVHRDIKGGNIVVKPDGHIKLIDFGCATRLYMPDPQSSFKDLLVSMKGTPYWMAPEVVKQEKYGTKSDIWSIGCTVFEMATCKPPWADRNQMSAMFAIGQDKEPIPQLPGKFSRDMVSFYNACLTRCPDSRPSASDFLRHHPFVMNRRKML